MNWLVTVWAYWLNLTVGALVVLCDADPPGNDYPKPTVCPKCMAEGIEEHKKAKAEYEKRLKTWLHYQGVNAS